MAAEEDIQIFLEEIQELTQNLRDLTRTVVSVDSAILAKFGAAVQKNTKAVEDNTAAMKGSGKLVDQFGREIKTATTETKESIKVQKESTEATRREISDKMRHRSTANELFREFGRGVSVTQLMRDRFENLGGESIAATAGLKAATAGLEGIVKATTAMASALYRGERGAQVSAKALTELVTPLADLGISVATLVTVLSMFGPAGLIGRGLKIFGTVVGALGVATKVAAKYNELAAEQTDKLLKSFNEISKAGVNLTGGFGQVFEMAQTLGLTVAELEEFNRLLASNTQTLSMFGGTAAKGAERFAGAAGTLVREFGRELELMGVDRAEQREIAMSYMNIQARTGQIMNKSVGQLAAESAKYIKELDMLAELTGSTRKQQMEAREAAMAETRFRAARIDAERRGDAEQLRKLDIAERASAVARAAGDVRGATGILQMAAGRGALTTPEAIAAEQTYRMSELLRRPNPTEAEIAQHMGKSVEIQQRNFAGLTALNGGIDILQTDFVKSADLQRRQLIIAQEAEKAGYGREPVGVQKYLEDIREGRVKATPEMQAVIDAGRTQQNAAMMMDSGIRAFNGAAQLSLTASKTFADAVSKMPGARIIGGGLGTGGAAGGAAGRPGAAPSGGAAIGDLASKIVKAEGGAVNARNPYSSASGLGQITRGRYQDLVKNAAVGSKLAGTTFEQYQADAGLQQEALNAQIESLRSYLGSKGLSTTDAAVYMAHVFGPGGARQVLTHSDSVPVSALFDQGIISKNPAIFRGVNTVGDLKKVISDKMGGTGYRFGGVASGPTSGYLAQLHGTEAIIPMSNGQSIKVDMPDFSNSISQQMQSMSAQISRLDELVNLMRRQTQVSEKILQVSQA